MDRFVAVTSVAIALTLAGCSAGTTSGAANGIGADSDFGSLNGARVELSAVGGFAALSVTDAASHDGRWFAHVQRHICTQNCGAPTDSTVGVLSPAASDSLFNIVLEQARQLDRSDYGVTRNGADMMTYTLRITSGGSVRTVTADDGTMPPPMHRIVEALRGSIAAAQR